MGTELFEMTEFLKSRWEECGDARFDTLWRKELEAIPEFTTSKFTMIAGLLLPIWDRLPTDNMRIYRLETADKERIIGRLVTQDQLLALYNRLGLDCTLDLSAEEVVKAVMDQRSSLTLISNISLRRSLVMGQNRLELVGVSPAALSDYKQMGCFTEIIQWKTRLFVPTNDLSVLSRILEKHPVGQSVREGAAA